MYFIEVLGCTPMETAGYLAWFLPIQFTGGFMVAALESALLKGGVSLLTIRKCAEETPARRRPPPAGS